MIWNCVEDRVDNGTKYGRIIRKIVFGDIFADRTAVLSRNPIPVSAHTHLKAGDRIAFYDSNEIREASFLCSSEKDKLDPKYIIADLLNTEDDLRYFCKNHHLQSGNLFIMVIEAYKYLLNLKYKPNNTENRKRQAQEFLNLTSAKQQRLGEKPLTSPTKQSTKKILIAPKPREDRDKLIQFAFNESNESISDDSDNQLVINQIKAQIAQEKNHSHAQKNRTENNQSISTSPKTPSQITVIDTGEEANNLDESKISADEIEEIDISAASNSNIKIEADETVEEIDHVDSSQMFKDPINTSSLTLNLSGTDSMTINPSQFSLSSLTTNTVASGISIGRSRLDHISLKHVYRGKTSKGILFAVKDTSNNNIYHFSRNQHYSSPQGTVIYCRCVMHEKQRKSKLALSSNDKVVCQVTMKIIPKFELLNHEAIPDEIFTDVNNWTILATKNAHSPQCPRQNMPEQATTNRQNYISMPAAHRAQRALMGNLNNQSQLALANMANHNPFFSIIHLSNSPSHFKN